MLGSIACLVATAAVVSAFTLPPWVALVLALATAVLVVAARRSDQGAGTDK